ncbi:TIP41-like protein [Elysia marginata]|uniref:TIP41-like protein n=1 Tax=Elysia marginata TaxID=1093978 RepID=A0AAV4G8S7_9GAST|nr:TIP41-like protein [Elysia marginata]
MASVPASANIKSKPPEIKEFEFGPWKMTTCKSHILASEGEHRKKSDCEHIKNVVAPFDWTFTTNYKGTILQSKANASLKVSDTTEQINLDKLRRREPIHFYDDVLLFEDELSDNGTSIMNVKVRVMPSCFFILMRLFCRVDGVLIRVNDTRIYHEAGENYMLREFSSREEKTSNIPTAAHTDPNEVSRYLQLIGQSWERLEFHQETSNS